MMLTKAKKNEINDFLKHPERLDKLMKRAGNYSDRNCYGGLKKNLDSLGIHGTIHYYGSRLMKMGVKASDLDIFIDLGNFYWNTRDHEKNEDSLRKLHEILKRDHRWKIENIVLATKVPIVTARFIPHNLECDISFSNGSGVENTKLIRYVFELQPESLKLCMFVKKMIKLGGFDFRGYMVAMMVMFYLQKQGVLPSIRSVQSGLAKKEIDGWQFQFDPTKTIQSFGLRELTDFRPLALGFFRFYAHFDFANKAIVPYLGREVDRCNYKNGPDLAEFRGKLDEFNNDLPMAVTGAIRLDKNLAFDVGTKKLSDFISFCTIAETLLLETYGR